MIHRWKPFALTVLSALCIASTARSDVVNVVGHTQVSGGFTASIPGLTYDGLSSFNFDIDTDAPADVLGKQVGTFTYSAPAAPFIGGTTFTSTITITVPTVGIDTQSAAAVAGAAFGWGGGAIAFFDPPMHFSISNSLGSGSFDLRLRDIGFADTPDSGPVQRALSADITNIVFNRVSMPEPGVVELMLTLLAGLGYVFKRRVALLGKP